MSQHMKKPYGKVLFFGILSLTSYVGLFMNKAIVMDYFTRGGKYAALVIITVFYFSFVHGAFASNALDVLGIKAKK